MKSIHDMTIKVKTNDGKEELKSYSNRYYSNSEGFSWLGSSEPIKKIIESLPEYTRGKLKGEMQRCKYSDDLVISESYYNKVKDNRGFDWTSDDMTTKETFYFPDIPTLFITAAPKHHNALTIMRTIEKKAIGDYKHVSTFSDLAKCAELYEKLKLFKQSKEYYLTIEKRMNFDDLFYLYGEIEKERVYIGEFYGSKIKMLGLDVKLPKGKTPTTLHNILTSNYVDMLANEKLFKKKQEQKMIKLIELMNAQEAV